MQNPPSSSWLWLGLALLPCFATGCADGPFGELVVVNPWARRNWAEDEKYGPTFHRRLADLRALRTSVAALDPQQREQLAAEMSELVQTDEVVVLRTEAIAVLGELGTPSVMPALQAALSDPDKDVRIAACHAWGRISGSESLSTLVQVAEKEADVDVRIAAVEELGNFPDPIAVQALGKALDDNDPAVQFRAVQSLKSATGLEYGDSVPGWRDYLQGRQSTPPPGPSLVQRLGEWF